MGVRIEYCRTLRLLISKWAGEYIYYSITDRFEKFCLTSGYDLLSSLIYLYWYWYEYYIFFFDVNSLIIRS